MTRRNLPLQPSLQPGTRERPGARGEPAEEYGAEHDPHRVVASQEGDPDAVEADVIDERYGHLAVDAEHLLAAAEGRQRAADRQSQDRVQADAHTGVVRCPRREPHGPDLEPPPGAPQEQVDRRRRYERQEEAVVDPPEAESNERDARSEVYRGRAGDEPLAPQGVECQVGRQVDGDEVQHDRGDHLVRPEVRLQEARYRSPEEPRQGAAQNGQCHPQRAEKTQRDPEPGCGDGPDEELALSADVEESGPEGYGYGEAGEDQGRGGQEGTADG